MKKIIFLIGFFILFMNIQPLYAENNVTANIKLKKYIKEYKSSTANKFRVVSKIANLKTDKAINVLVKFLETKNHLLKNEIIYNLGKLKAKKAVPKLTKALKHDYTYTRSEAALALSKIKDKRSVKALRKFLENAGYGSKYAVKALLAMGDKKTIQLLFSHITTPGSGINASIIYDIPKKLKTEEFKDRVKELLKNEDSDIRIAAISMLGKMRVVKSAENIALLLKDGDDRVRKKAAYVLGDLKVKETLAQLLLVLKDKSPLVRREAIYSLALFKDENFGAEMGKVLASDKDPAVEKAAAYALGKIKGNDSFNALVKNLKTVGDSEVQIEIVKALAKFKTPESKRVLSKLRYHRDNTIRKEAKKAVSR